MSIYMFLSQANSYYRKIVKHWDSGSGGQVPAQSVKSPYYFQIKIYQYYIIQFHQLRSGRYYLPNKIAIFFITKIKKFVLDLKSDIEVFRDANYEVSLSVRHFTKADRLKIF